MNEILVAIIISTMVIIGVVIFTFIKILSSIDFLREDVNTVLINNNVVLSSLINRVKSFKDAIEKYHADNTKLMKDSTNLVNNLSLKKNYKILNKFIRDVGVLGKLEIIID